MFYIVATAFAVGAAMITPTETLFPTPYKTMKECVLAIPTEVYRHENVSIIFTCIYVEERRA